MAKPEKKTGRQPNRVYATIRGQARDYLKIGLGIAEQNHTALDETGGEYKDTVLENIALALAYIRLAERYGYGPNPKDLPLFHYELGKEAEKMAGRIKSSDVFRAVTEPLTGREVCKLLGKEKESGSWAFSGVDKFTEKYDKKAQECAPEVTRQRWRRLAARLEASTQNSFVGKIKSFFVGNSRQYETALRAVRGLAAGTANEAQAAQAAQDIMEYLDIRKDKVRDHQYGRDRFDAMMSCLATVMEPRAFERYCKDVDDSRRARDPNYRGHTDPNAFLSEENRELLADAKAREAAEQRAREDELQAESDREMIERNNNNSAARADSLGLLNYLRDMVNPTEKNRKWVKEQLLAHPEAREAARRIVQARNADAVSKGKSRWEIEIPTTPLDKMDENTKRMLSEQEKALEQLDRAKHPELYPEQQVKQPEQAKGPEPNLG